MSAITDYSKFNYADSCSIEDAAMYLMGYPQSYLQAKWVQFSDDPSDGEWISIEGYQYLAEDWDVAKSALEEAKKYQALEHKNAGKLAELIDGANQNAENIDKIIASRLIELNILATQEASNLNQATINKQAELVKLTEQYNLARSYRTAIINEIAKGAASSLHIDPVASPNARNPYITLLSLKTWAYKVLKISILNDLNTVNPENPLPLLHQQEIAVLDEIKKLGYDPKRLPKIEPGKRTLKAQIEKILLNHILFKDKKTVFKKTWERLSVEEIAFLK